MRLLLLALLLAPPCAGGAQPFAPGSLLAVRIGNPSFNKTAHAAMPVALVEFTPAGVVLQTVPLPTSGPGAFALTLQDEREGDLDVDFSRCAATLLGYRSPADGRPLALSSAGGACPCVVPLAGAVVSTDGTTDTASIGLNFSANAQGGPGYGRADGLQRRPDGQLYVFAGESGGCALQLAAAGEPVALATVATGWAARGMQIAGRELDRLQLYAGSGSGVLRVGAGLPSSSNTAHSYVIRAPGSADFGGSFDFESDYVAWVVVGENGTTTPHSLHRYVCTPPTDDGSLPCPESGVWARDESVNFVCLIQGKPLSLWYIAGVYGGSAPVIFASTHREGTDNSLGDVGTNVIVSLDTSSGVCTVVLPAAIGAVWRGISLAPDAGAAACAAASATATPSGSSTASASASASATSTPSSDAPAAVAGGVAQPSPGAVAGAVFGALAAVALLSVGLAVTGVVPVPAAAAPLVRSLAARLPPSWLRGGGGGAEASALLKSRPAALAEHHILRPLPPLK